MDPCLDEENLLPCQDFDLEIDQAMHDVDAIINCLPKRNRRRRRVAPIVRMGPGGNQKPDKNLCNFNDNIPTLVGILTPKGDHPYYDCGGINGNVWEWTASLWGKNRSKPDFKMPYTFKDGRENLKSGVDILRVVRGGAFYNNADDGCCACRFRNFSNYRLRDFGFRIVCVFSRASLYYSIFWS